MPIYHHHPQGMSAKILIVDDEIIVAESTRSLLSELGYAPTDVASCESEVLESIGRNAPDLVLMDINLGHGFEGIDIAAKILERWGIPVVYATAYADETVLSKAKLTQPYGYVTKPFDERDLRVAIEIGLHNHDVARRLRETERSLAASEARYRHMIESTEDLVTSIDAAGCYTYVNKRFEQLFALSPGACLGKPSFAFVCEHDRDGVLLWFEEILRQNKPSDMIEVSLRGADGRLREIQWNSVFRRDDRGTIVEITSIGRDITGRNLLAQERLESERQLLKRHNLESLGRMSGAVAHHFNNKLQAVIMGLSTVEPELPAGSYPWDLCQEAMNAARSAATVSRALLAYLGHRPSEPKPLELGQTVQDCLSLLRPTLDPGVALTVTAADAPVWVLADPAIVEQALERLLTNAIEATEHAAIPIAISLGRTEPGAIDRRYVYPSDWQRQAASYGFLEVSDNGCGMTPQQMESLFEPFFSTKFTGRGLGLPTLLGSIRACGGGVTVVSAPGKGSSFRVHFPSAASPAATDPGAAPVRLEGTVLLVENEASVRRAAEAGLARLGCSVLSAATGAAAIELFRARRSGIRCVLLDLAIRDTDGWETLAELRRIDSRIPVVMSSGYASSQVREKQGVGAPEAFLQKPYTMDEMARTLRYAFGLDFGSGAR
jgi:PAS domain S-box-containing protein